MFKKYILGILLALSVPALVAYAANPVLTVQGSGDNNNVMVNVSGADAGASVVLYYNSTVSGGLQSSTLGTTNASGTYSGTFSTSNGVNSATPVFVLVNGYQSGSVTWPYMWNGTTTTATSTTEPNGSLMLSASSLSVNQGSQGSVTLSGGISPYTVSVTNGSGVSTTLSGNTLYVNGNATGTNMLRICSANSGTCSDLSVTVQAQTQTNTNPTMNGTSWFTLPFTVGQNMVIPLNGSGYYLQSATNSSSPVMASISGNNLMLNGQMMGGSSITICQTGGNTCMPIMFSVSQPSTSTGGTGAPTSGKYFFSTNLSVGSSGQDVMELQHRLGEAGYFNATATGYFGSITEASVRAYQSAHGISSIGVVGPQTRAMLNQ